MAYRRAWPRVCATRALAAKDANPSYAELGDWPTRILLRKPHPVVHPHHKNELTMSKIIGLIKTLLSSSQSRKDRDESYPEESADVHDLERRIRDVDGRSRNSLPGLQYGLGLR